jgi:hypothetical protein
MPSKSLRVLNMILISTQKTLRTSSVHSKTLSNPTAAPNSLNVVGNSSRCPSRQYLTPGTTTVQSFTGN